MTTTISRVREPDLGLPPHPRIPKRSLTSHHTISRSHTHAFRSSGACSIRNELARTHCPSIRTWDFEDLVIVLFDKTGLNAGDVQALQWYPEKWLYDSAKAPSKTITGDSNNMDKNISLDGLLNDQEPLYAIEAVAGESDKSKNHDAR